MATYVQSVVQAQSAAATRGSALVLPTNQEPIFASRYKIILCQKMETTGRCPYEDRCMFAHGVAELRTTEMNLADGITTEEDIKEHRRQRISFLRKQGRKRKSTSRKAKTGNSQSGDTPPVTETSSITSAPGSPGISPTLSAATPQLAPAPLHQSVTGSSSSVVVGPPHDPVVSMPGVDTVALPASWVHSCCMMCGSREWQATCACRMMTPQEKTQGYHTHTPYGA